jgi:hypothetical protein
MGTFPRGILTGGGGGFVPGEIINVCIFTGGVFTGGILPRTVY